VPKERRAFFTPSEVTSRKPIGLVPQCAACKLDLGCLSPRMPLSGNGKKEILIVGEASGATEDSQNRPFVGKAGQYLQTCLSRQGIDLREDCWITNSLSCRPPKNRKPTEREITFCRPKVINHIQELKPKLIILLGDAAVKSVMTWLWKDKVGSISRWAGWRIPSQQINAWVTPTFHPSHVKRSEDRKGRLDPILELYFNQHLEEACKRIERPWKEVPDWKQQCKVILYPAQAAHMIREVISMNKPTAFDFETEGLKPEQKNGYKLDIFSCSLSNGLVTFAYPWIGETIEATKEFLFSGVPKIGANSKFENRFVLERFGRPVNNWIWDVCEAAHIGDNRPEISSVKFQSFVLLGQQSYDDSIKPYLKAKDGGGYGRNRIREANLESILSYCAMDSLLEFKLAKVQSKNLGLDLERWLDGD
jgi:uracil-DNA glycosylase family 4